MSKFKEDFYSADAGQIVLLIVLLAIIVGAKL